jgi:hypothetical protein
MDPAKIDDLASQVSLCRHSGFVRDVSVRHSFQTWSMEQHTLRNVNNCLNTNIYSYSETSGDQSCNLYINFVHFFQH